MIFNPASGRGRGRKRMAAYRALLEEALPSVAYGATEYAGHERELAERALSEGFDVIVAVGGDGTWSNVADRVVASGRDDALFAVLPSGTGNDFSRNLGYDPRNAKEAVRVLAEGHVREVDVGRVDTECAPEHHPDRHEPRHFLNLVGFGFDIAVIDAAAGARFLRGELLYKLTALQQLFRFPGIGAAVHAGDGRSRELHQLMLTVSNGRFFGGGFPIAPGATVDDGRLHACLIGDAPPLTRLRLFNLAETGRHVTSDRVEVIDDASFRLVFDGPVRFEVDGDVWKSPGPEIEVRALRRALRVVAPKH